MKTMRSFLILSAAILIAGCATTFRPWNLSQIQEGMDRASVVHILGEPDSAEMRNGAEYLLYTYSEDYNPALTSGDAAVDDATRSLRDLDVQRSLREYTYEVMLVDGVVVNYKEVNQTP